MLLIFSSTAKIFLLWQYYNIDDIMYNTLMISDAFSRMQII